MKKIYILLGFVLSFSINSQEIVDEAILTQVDASNESIKLQEQINKLDEESKKIYFEYKDTLNEYKSLKSYDDQLSKIVDQQATEIQSILAQIDSLDDINIDILPLLKRMVDSLKLFIGYDLPFLLDERTKRVNDLDVLITRADVTTAEKFRKIFEAYQLEADFGRTIESYDGFIDIDGIEKAVEYFRLGRLGLFYRTPDGKETGYWNANIKDWQHEGSSLNANLKSALDIANRQSPPNFINLPLKPVDTNE
tara:strand:+ start:126 stop:881 length:756 start_codon:yes stop_codon:yes gene_type:complete